MINAAAMRHTKRAFALQLYRLRTVSVFAYDFKQILGFQPYRRRVFVRMNPDRSGAFEKIAVRKKRTLPSSVFSSPNSVTEPGFGARIDSSSSSEEKVSGFV